MERYGVVRDGLVLWVECFAEADRMIKQYGGRLVCEPEVVRASDRLQRPSDDVQDGFRIASAAPLTL